MKAQARKKRLQARIKQYEETVKLRKSDQGIRKPGSLKK